MIKKNRLFYLFITLIIFLNGCAVSFFGSQKQLTISDVDDSTKIPTKSYLHKDHNLRLSFGETKFRYKNIDNSLYEDKDIYIYIYCIIILGRLYYYPFQS